MWFVIGQIVLAILAIAKNVLMKKPTEGIYGRARDAQNQTYQEAKRLEDQGHVISRVALFRARALRILLNDLKLRRRKTPSGK